METVFLTIISVNQLTIYGAVTDVCEEYTTCQTKTVRPVLARQSETLFEPAKFLIMTPRPSIEILAQEKLLQVQRTSGKAFTTRSSVKKIVLMQGFLRTVEVGQYFMTKDTDEFSHFTEPVTCREYTLPRDEKSTDPKGVNSTLHTSHFLVG